MSQDDDPEIEQDDELSAMAWELAARGKSGREIAQLHETWAAALLARNDFDRAQEHLDKAVKAWTGYEEPILLARAWCLKASCSSEAGDFSSAAAGFKTAQKLAEDAGDVPLVLCVMTNRAICEVRLGDSKAAATRSRRAFVRAEAEGGPDTVLMAHFVRASSYQMAGNFLAACNEHEAAARLIEEGHTLPPAPALAIAMDTNFGLCLLRSGKPGRASGPFERALATLRIGPGIVGSSGGNDGKAPLALARCLFHAGEARRQNREFHAANAFLEETADIVDLESAAVEASEADTAASAAARKPERSRWAALGMEVANSRGLCAIAEAASLFSCEAIRANAAEATAEATAPVKDSVGSGTDGASFAKAATEMSAQEGAEMAAPREGRVGCLKETPNSSTRRNSKQGGGGSSARTAAGKAATLIAAGCKAGEAGAHPMQKTNGAVLEGLAWSIAGRGGTEGAAAMKRAERGLENILERERRPSAAVSAASSNRPSGGTSEAIGVSVPAGSESAGQLQTLQLGVLSSQGLVARGGVGMGAGFSTGAAAMGTVPGKGVAAAGDAAGALAAVAAARTAAKAASAGWSEAGSIAKKQLTYAAQATTESARQLALAHANAGTVDLMMGKPAVAAGHFERQLHEARTASDIVLEALAERNLADTRDVDEDLPGVLAHLRRCRTLAQRSRNTTLEADVCRRLSSVYAEIAAAAGDSSADGGGGGEGNGGDGGGGRDRNREGEERRDGEGGLPGTQEGEDGNDGNSLEGRPETASLPQLETEIDIEEREDTDFEFLKASAGDRALLFAERYEAAVSGSQWPASGDDGGDARVEGG